MGLKNRSIPHKPAESRFFDRLLILLQKHGLGRQARKLRTRGTYLHKRSPVSTKLGRDFSSSLPGAPRQATRSSALYYAARSPFPRLRIYSLKGKRAQGKSAMKLSDSFDVEGIEVQDI